MIDEVGLEPKTAKDFFQNQLMKLEPHLLTDLGMKYIKFLFVCLINIARKLHPRKEGKDELLGFRIP